MGIVASRYLKDKLVNVRKIEDIIIIIKLEVEKAIMHIISAHASHVGLNKGLRGILDIH